MRVRNNSVQPVFASMVKISPAPCRTTNSVSTNDPVIIPATERCFMVTLTREISADVNSKLMNDIRWFYF